MGSHRVERGNGKIATKDPISLNFESKTKNYKKPKVKTTKALKLKYCSKIIRSDILIKLSGNVGLVYIFIKQLFYRKLFEPSFSTGREES